MSVDLTHYLGIGFELDYDSNIEKVDAFLDEHPEYSDYKHLNPNADKPGLQIITDGMNGNYIYILYVLKKVEDEALYSSSADFSMHVFDLVNHHGTDEVWDLYKEIFGEYYDGDDAPCLVSFFHCT
jgi:hypothetical protein